jgi:hypothetical protein
MKPLKSQIKIDADLLLTSFIDAIFIRLHQKYKTTSGDISPSQQYQLDEAKEKICHLMTEQVFYNIDFSTINLKKLNRDELMEMAKSLDWNGSWDCDEEGQKPITRNELIESITNLISHHN